MSRIVHTADWHLGARLVDCDRIDEHRAFLEWFLGQMKELRPDLLIIAGDIFDCANPPQEALALYYRFLARLSASMDGSVLVLGGNHDSPATLNAPREILGALRVRVLGALPENPEEWLHPLPDACVCGIPFLRERDVRKGLPGQSPDEIAAAIREGIQQIYTKALTLAASRHPGLPVIGTGHLTAAGSLGSPSERSIHIGNLGAVGREVFQGFAYTALGHIHKAQCVGKQEEIRYSGSPIPLSFSELEVAKEFRVIEITEGRVAHRPVPIPVFRRLERLECTQETLGAELKAREAASPDALAPWLELTITGLSAATDANALVREACAGLRLQVLKLLTPRTAPKDSEETGLRAARGLSGTLPADVFMEKLRRSGISADAEEARLLGLSFSELLEGLQEERAVVTTADKKDTAK